MDRIKLNDDVLLYMSGKYLSAVDMVSLAFSGESNRFSYLYSMNRENLVIKGCFFITSESWREFFKAYINPASIKTFDVSTCYWFPAEVILEFVKEMVNLEELSVEDTQISLTHLASIFEVCPKLVKLNFSLREDTLDCFDPSIKLKLSQGFTKLTHLKMFTLCVNKNLCVESWLVTFGVLIWFNDCKHLLIEVCHNSQHYAPHAVKKTKPIPKGRCDKVIKIAAKELYPHLGWIRSLISFVVVKHDYGNSQTDVVLQRFCSWLFKGDSPKMLPNWPNLKNLWIENRTNPKRVLPKDFSAQQNWKSLWEKDFNESDELQDLFHTDFEVMDEPHSPEAFPLLQYARGNSKNAEWFRRFCVSHPSLEFLHFDDLSEEGENMFVGNWMLPSLKVLVYEVYSHPSHRVEHPFKRMYEAFPNILDLHLNLNLSKEDAPDFFANISARLI